MTLTSFARTIKRYIYLQQDVLFGEFFDEKDEEGFSFHVTFSNKNFILMILEPYIYILLVLYFF